MYLDIEVLFKVFIFWQLSLMSEPSYVGNKMGDTRITKIHRLITAEGFLSWKHFNLNLFIKVFLQTLPTNINSVWKGRFCYSFILGTCPFIHASVHLSIYLWPKKKKKIKVKFTIKQKCYLFSPKSNFQRRHSRQNTFVHQYVSNPVKTLLWRGHFLKEWQRKHWTIIWVIKEYACKRITFLLPCGEFFFIM